MPSMPPPPIQPQPALPIPPHGNVLYRGASQPQQQHYVRGVEARVNYTATVLQATENAHAERHRNHQRCNAHAALGPAAPIPNPPAEPNHNHVNVDFQQNIFNVQHEAEEQQWQQLQWEAQQAAEERQHLQWAAEERERQAAEERQQLQLMAEERERQAAEERQKLEWMAEQAERQAAQEELLRQEVDHWHRLAQAEQECLCQEAEQQCLTQEHSEHKQQEHLEDL
ncbi:hypothetical protein PAXRUDRAFT_12978 [Paxillus rubicundulus Ve08.2h10]|uniref:Uncharacterized protein n=1 Tax=Paxillus rubicundulus Ve08.2h10 TaxID=930991 RepID=A0A0D0E5S3_9AGAM|nr:hypothetical protein PAXRUDRAFT_12978 [Paxillus rubicundulus Ve08.2h10]